jgi:hypothetical protein
MRSDYILTKSRFLLKMIIDLILEISATDLTLRHNYHIIKGEKKHVGRLEARNIIFITPPEVM